MWRPSSLCDDLRVVHVDGRRHGAGGESVVMHRHQTPTPVGGNGARETADIGNSNPDDAMPRERAAGPGGKSE